MGRLEIRTDDDVASAFQMSLDARLLDAVREPMLRFYVWDPPAVSVGRAQDPDLVADRAALDARGWGLVTRPTGGGAVLHHGDMTFSLFLPRDAAGSPRGAYRLLREVVTGAIGRFAARGDLLSRPAAGRTQGPVCFLGGHDDEVWAGEGKCAGIALRWMRTACLAQVSLLLVDNADNGAACLLPPRGIGRGEFAGRLRAAACPLASMVDDLPDLGTLREAVADEVARLVG